MIEIMEGRQTLSKFRNIAAVQNKRYALNCRLSMPFEVAIEIDIHHGDGNELGGQSHNPFGVADSSDAGDGMGL